MLILICYFFRVPIIRTLSSAKFVRWPTWWKKDLSFRCHTVSRPVNGCKRPPPSRSCASTWGEPGHLYSFIPNPGFECWLSALDCSFSIFVLGKAFFTFLILKILRNVKKFCIICRDGVKFTFEANWPWKLAIVCLVWRRFAQAFVRCKGLILNRGPERRSLFTLAEPEVKQLMRCLFLT